MSLPVLSPFSPLSAILDDIQKAIDAKLYYPALLVALTVPEICSALALDNSVMVRGKHYRSFVDKYTTPRELGCSGEDCYRLRGGVVHRANMAGHADFEATHVIFSLPESQGSVHALSIVNVPTGHVAAMFDLVAFCDAMVSAAKKWFEDHQNDELVKANMINLIRYSQNGVAPFVKGTAVVASGA